MAPDLFDSHCHLDVDEFAADRDAVIARAEAAGVAGQLLPAIARDGWDGLHAVCSLAPGLHPAYGLHPMFVAAHRPRHLEELERWIADAQPCAVGECGLDFFVDDLDPEAQRFFFRRQLEIARAADLPVVIHARRAVEEVISTLRAIGGLRGVVHSFPGSEEQARQLAGLGFLLGIGGPVTYERAKRLRRVVASVPLDWLLLETDSPDQPDAAHRGERNEPARLALVARTVAELRGQPLEQVAAATTGNAHRLFGLAGAAATPG